MNDSMGKVMLAAVGVGLIGGFYYYFLFKVILRVRPWVKPLVEKLGFLRLILLPPIYMLVTPPFVLANIVHKWLFGVRMLDFNFPGARIYVIIFSLMSAISFFFIWSELKKAEEQNKLAR